MPEELFNDIRRYVGFTDADASHLVELGGYFGPRLTEIADQFYERLLSDPRARSVFTEGAAQMERQRRVFHLWLTDLFCGRYDVDYFMRRANIGRVHVRVKLPQHYMVTAMNVVRQALGERLAALKLPDEAAKRRAIGRILDIDLAIMLDTYREDLIGELREAEQEAYEHKLRESEHLATVGQLAASLAHEIKNPLAGISGALQVIRAGIPADHPHHEILHEALIQIDRLDSAVKDLLLFSRPKTPTRKSTSIRDMLHRSMILHRDDLARRGLAVHIEDSAGDVSAAIDEVQMQQVLANLLINAAQACGPGGQVTCRYAENGDKVRIEVEDTGLGMTAEVAARAFEPFFTTKAKGTGLGLAICQRIVEAHGGHITLESQRGVGTRAVIDLPKQL